MSRGKAAELILSIRTYAEKASPLVNLSRGCLSPKSLPTGTYTRSIAGKTRSYILSVPGSYNSTHPARLILAIHGRTNSNTMVQGYMGIEGRKSDSQDDFIIAYPAGLPSGSAYSWSSEENLDFIDTIIHDISESHCIDRDNISVVAHSLGAWFASKLVCTRGDVFRSMAIVGGGGWSSGCNSTPTATLIYQNENDHLSSPTTARITEKTMKKVNLCGEISESVSIGELTCQQWKDCSTGNPVIWCSGYRGLLEDPH
jgi:pimeloyl-ACP methyl ester carboxylesterase